MNLHTNISPIYIQINKFFRLRKQASAIDRNFHTVTNATTQSKNIFITIQFTHKVIIKEANCIIITSFNSWNHCR